MAFNDREGERNNAGGSDVLQPGYSDGLTLVPRDQYRILLKKAMDSCPPIDMIEYLFSKEEMEWLKEQYATSRLTQGRLQDTPPSTPKAS